MYPIIRYLGFWVIVIIVQVSGKYMIIRYLDPSGLEAWDLHDAANCFGLSLKPKPPKP